MNNEPVAWMWYQSKENTNPYTQMTGYSQLFFSEFKPDENVKVDEGTLTPLYIHPVKDREKDRLRFSDEAFNRWLDEGISDSGHTVYDLVKNVCEAWRGWENSQYYTHPVKELTDEEIEELIWNTTDMKDFARAILRKASEK
jgi:ribosomal protein S16